MTRCGMGAAMVCANTQTDAMHCGSCGSACPMGQSCVAGLCRPPRAMCPPDLTDCMPTAPAPRCVNTQTDARNCGTCGMGCPSGQLCVLGTCRTECTSPMTACGGGASMVCTNTQTDPRNCRVCGVACPAPTGGTATCTAGVCGASCPTGQANCGGTCLATGGACTSVGSGGCQQPGTTVCVRMGSGTECLAAPRTSGACATPTGGTCNAMGACVCPTGRTACGEACVDTQTDGRHCGGCGAACPSGQSCVAGSCRIACDPPRSICGSGAGQTCDDLGTDNAHCGTCTTVCATGQVCAARACTTDCAAPRTMCPSGCVDRQSDRANCGTCGRACATGQACAVGVCVGEGALRVTLTWDTNGDMDLHVLPPCGTEISFDRLMACGGTLDEDDTTGRGPENVFWSGSFPSGTYYFCPEAYSASVTDARWTLTVSRGGSTILTRSGVRGRTDGNVPCNASFAAGAVGGGAERQDQ
ncbi:MAG: hypothetical protein HY909_21060 [Deltaproteobacteria bacterium]|nr:hypothetical protein [Deltaproteobacteria bacterium]